MDFGRKELISMNAKEGQTRAGRFVLGGLILLAVGVAVGMAAEKLENGNSLPTAKNTAAPPAVVATNMEAAGSVPITANGTQDPYQEMRGIQAQMDQMFQRSMARLQMDFDQGTFTNETPGFSQSLDVRNLKDRYEVRAYLPDANAAKVRLDGNELSVDVTSQQAEKQSTPGGQAVSTEWGRFEQMVQLAGNLKSDQMKVERKNHELIITIPKTMS
jgi:HSP20 family molecular chaperone IbpA